MIKFWKAKKMFSNYQISLNGQKLWQKRTNSDRSDYMIDIPIDIDFNVNQENSVLTFCKNNIIQTGIFSWQIYWSLLQY